MTKMKRFAIWALAPVMKLWTWHVLRKCRCGVCGEIMTRREAEQIGGRCAGCYFKALLEYGRKT
jgi:hypothetical protein